MRWDPSQGVVTVSRRVYRWWVAVMWFITSTFASFLWLLGQAEAPLAWAHSPGPALEASVPFAVLGLISLHLVPVGLRLPALGKPMGWALMVLIPIIGQGMYVWLLFADRPGPGHGSFPRSVESASDASKRARAERISVAHSRSRPNPNPAAQPKSANRPSAAEWVKATSYLR